MTWEVAMLWITTKCRLSYKKYNLRQKSGKMVGGTVK